MASVVGHRVPAAAALPRALGAKDGDTLWRALAGASVAGFGADVEPGAGTAATPGPEPDPDRYDTLFPGDRDRILVAAEAALARRVDLLGSGPVQLGRPIDWHRDYKTGHRWPVAPGRALDYAVLGEPCDVKIPWELSRLQWLIPLGQAYRLTGEARYPEGAREIIEEWIAANPYGTGVNWLIAMEAALRAIALVWLFRACHDAPAWRDTGFREKLLHLLYLHGDFIERHLEPADVNGNHLTADAAGLVILGLWFGRGTAPQRWHRRGWRILAREIRRQVHPDGVSFEASTAYHRLVAELFLVPALHRLAHGLEVPAPYRARLEAMADFCDAYTRRDGSVPLWGDADDGRALPFGGQGINDHRYLSVLIRRMLTGDAPATASAQTGVEAYWLLGPGQPNTGPPAASPPSSRAFPDGGVYIMRHGDDHVFIDCGPVGFGGRGGHGHNDCLSFEAVLRGVKLIGDSGCYVYTASVAWRNRFRGTAVHNTPMVDGEELNRLVHPNFLWLLRNDARPRVHRWETTAQSDLLVGSHDGYRRLANPVTPVRGIMLDKAAHRLIVLDRFEGAGDHHITVPFHLAPGVSIGAAAPGVWRLAASHREFLFVCADDDWRATVRPAWQSPSYGIKYETKALEFSCDGPLRPLRCALMPADGAPENPVAWLTEICAATFSPA